MADKWRSTNLIYRALETDDAAFYHRTVSHSESLLQCNAKLARPRSTDDAKTAIAYEKSLLLSVIICLPATQDDAGGAPIPIGLVSLRNEAHLTHHRHATLDVLLMRQYQGKGHGSEAIRWILDWGFRMANLHRIELQAYS